MTQQTSEWMPTIALVVSVASLCITAYVARWNIRLTRAQKRTDLLTQIVDLRLQYNRFNRRISELKTNPPANIPEELRCLFDGEAQFRNFEHQTELYRRTILESESKFDGAVLENLRHPIEALLKQLEADNERLDRLLQSNHTIERGAPHAGRPSL